MPHSEFVELIVTVGAATATNPNEIVKHIAQPPSRDPSEFYRMLNVLKDDGQWHDCVTADDLNTLRILQANAAAQKLKIV